MEKVIVGDSMRQGLTQSCGCFRREFVRAAKTTHGHASHHTPEYRAWYAMRTRCTNPRQKDWHLYGGRGITVDPRWKSFETFLADMGPKPPGLTLDRIDPEKGYGPDNCRWATWSQQRLNQRRMKVA